MLHKPLLDISVLARYGKPGSHARCSKEERPTPNSQLKMDHRHAEK